MRKLKLNLFLIASLALLFTACSKDGPAGPAGATGATGPQGPAGPQGPTGTANVIYSSWTATAATDWDSTHTFPYWAKYEYNRTATGITQTIIDNGVVLCYMKNWPYVDWDQLILLRSSSTVQLPYTADPDFFQTYDFAIASLGKIKFMYKENINYDLFTDAELAGTTFRYVIIPGGVAGGRGVNVTYEGYTADELKKMPYEDVARIFKIPEDGTNIR